MELKCRLNSILLIVPKCRQNQLSYNSKINTFIVHSPYKFFETWETVYVKFIF